MLKFGLFFASLLLFASVRSGNGHPTQNMPSIWWGWYWKWTLESTIDDCRDDCRSTYPGWSCRSAWVDGGLWDNECHCDTCQRDCDLQEISKMDKCKMGSDDIVLQTIRATHAMTVATEDFANNLLAGIPVVGPFAAAGAIYVKALDRAQKDSHTYLNNVIDEVNNKNEQVMDCMAIQIDKLTLSAVGNQFQYAFDKVEDVKNYIGNDMAKKGWIKDAYEAFYEPITTVLDDPQQEWSYLKNLSFSQEVAPAFYFISLEYLLYEFQIDPANFDATIYPKNIKAWTTFRDWAIEAKGEQHDYLWAEMRKKPCMNPETIAEDIKARQAAFEQKYISPIVMYANSIRKEVKDWRDIKYPDEDYQWGFDKTAPYSYTAVL